VSIVWPRAASKTFENSAIMPRGGKSFAKTCFARVAIRHRPGQDASAASHLRDVGKTKTGLS
jgi:hypothetical protein